VRKNFNEFVNQYRLAAVKKKLLESGNEHLTITGIAFECGFNSQATFQRVFKQTTGVSPTQFLAQHSRKSA
jgi:AraC-like DNA-binding protein